MDTLYKNIRKRRNELGLSQADLAKRLGYSDKSTIARIEKGETDLGVDKVKLFAEALGTTELYLMGLGQDSKCDFVLTDGEHAFLIDVRKLPEDRKRDIHEIVKAYLALDDKEGSEWEKKDSVKHSRSKGNDTK